MSAEVNENQGRRRKTDEPVVDAEGFETDDEENKGLSASKGRPTAGRRNKQTEEDSGNPVSNFFGGIVEYFQGVQSELDKVSWPNRDDVIRLTRIVLSVTVLASIVLGLIAYGFTMLFAEGLRNPLVFVIFFAVVGVLAFIITRRSRNNSSEPSLTSRL